MIQGRLAPRIQTPLKLLLALCVRWICGEICDLVRVAIEIVQLLAPAIVRIEFPTASADGANRINPFLLRVVFEKDRVACTRLAEIDAGHRCWPIDTG